MPLKRSVMQTSGRELSQKMEAEGVYFTVCAAARSVAGRSFGLAGPLATGRAVLFPQRAAIGDRNDSPDQSTKQGNAEGKRSLPNPRLQASRPRPRLLGGGGVAHHRAMSEATTVAGARLKRRVRRRLGQRT